MEAIENVRIALLYFGGLFATIGLIPLIIGIVQWCKFAHMKKHCTQKIGGRIFRYRNLATGTATPVVEYFINGKRYEQHLKYKWVIRVRMPHYPTNTPAPANPLAPSVTVYRNSFVSSSNVPAIANVLPIGMFLDVFFNPENPQESYVVRPVKTFSFYFCFFLGLSFFLVGIGIFTAGLVMLFL